MTKLLRNAARGKPCMYRGPNCVGGGETVVLCHIRKAGVAGMGMKPPDTLGFWACHMCHDLADGRRREPGFSSAILNHYAFDALCRTLKALDEEGYQMVYRGTK